ncbi:hypothetical protein BKA63DRAFT_157810 [Paraphoma chrysanthemicola]|nr:hypothetical protein BKA63DRAFT_157810 [Paraphoma chrysanthemicola]
MVRHVWILVSMITLPTTFNCLCSITSLCLTSKAFRATATPHLYAKIIINLVNADEVRRYLRSMVVGGSVHLKATRSLTLIDSVPSPEPYYERPLRFLAIRQAFRDAISEYGIINSLVEYNLALVIDTLPVDCLHTFRFLSTNAISLDILLELKKGQGNSLQRLQLSYNDDALGYLRFRNLKALDLWLPKPGQTAPQDPQRSPRAYPTAIRLEQLCLAAAHDYGVDYSTAVNHTLQDINVHWLSQNTIKVLTLCGLSLSLLEPSFAQIVHLPTLAQLTLWSCSGAHEFLTAIVQSPNFAALRLRHFGLEIHPDSEQFIEEPLEALLGSSMCLSSLCLQWDGARGYEPRALLSEIQKIGTNLRILSLHGMQVEPLGLAEFGKVCKSCPNLEQLGYRKSHTWNEYTVDEDYVSMASQLVDLDCLPKLKILHLRQNFRGTIQWDPYMNETDLNALLAFRLHKAASKIFECLTENNQSPALEAVVIGQGSQSSIQDEEEYVEHTKLHCYLKGELRDAAGRRRVVASPITPHELRVTMDYAGILDWHTRRSELGEWISRVPGRFNYD